MRLLSLVGIAGGMVLLAAGAALAYWQTTDSSHAAAALAATLSAPTGGAQNGTATPSSIPISWTAPAGYTPAGYTVLRCTGSVCTPGSSPTVGGCSNVITSVVTATSCTDSDTSLVPNTTYTYEVEAVLDNWVSGPSSTFQGKTTAISKLTFTTQPAAGQNIQAKGSGSFSVSVAIQDSGGATDLNDNSDTVTLAIGTNPSGGVLSCTNAGGLTVTASAGLANFTGCAITLAGTGYKLTASSATSPSLTVPANANAFNITAGLASNLTFTAQPTSGQNIQAKGTGSFSVSVAVKDANGNTETGDSSTAVTLAIGTNPGGGVLSCTNAGGLTVTDASGVSNFTGCAITLAGTGYTLAAASSPAYTSPTNANAFNITAGTASQLSFTTQPGAGQNIQAKGTGSFPASAAVQDQNGNTLTGDSSTSVTLAIGTNPGGGVLSCTNAGGLTVTDASGVANFTGCAITLVGTGYKLTATASSLTAPANAHAFNIIPGPASQLSFTTQPSAGQDIQATGTGSFSASVAVQDQDGNAVSTDTGRPITLAIGTNPSGGVLTCTNVGGLTVSDASGVSNFTGCAITLAGTGYKLTATASSLTAPTNANAFNIIAGAPAYLGFSNITVPITGATAATCTPNPGAHTNSCTVNNLVALASYTADVTLLDQNGNLATSGSSVTVSLSSSVLSGVAPGTVTITAGTSTSSSTFTETLGLGGGTVTASATVNSTAFQSTIRPAL